MEARVELERVCLSVITVLMLAAPVMATGVWASGGSGEVRSGPFGQTGQDPVWTDDLEDTSHVYIPDGGLIGVEVAGGEARLLPGSEEGWLASEIITCPTGYRYDVVVLDAVVPGDSYIEMAMLNASQESTGVGYANETIPPFVGKRTMPLDLYRLDPVDFPEVRIQVTLHASGADRPRLRAWSLSFIDLEEWRDDLLGTSKLQDTRRILISGGQAMLDLASFGPSVAWYDPFPPIIFSRTSQPSKFDAFYPTTTLDGYTDATAVDCTGTLGVGVTDLNEDGCLDLICANSPHGGVDKDSQIYWGSASGTWSPTGATNLMTVGAERVATGDFDADGDTDILITCLRTSATVDTVVFLNRDGSFNRQPDIVLTQDDPREAAAGDLDGDGCDDIVLAEDGTSRCFLGGSGGPNTTPDISFPVGTNCDEVKLRDLDDDGHLDVMFATLKSGKALLFIGGPDGPDNTPDYSLSVPGTRCYGGGSGDLNGDGYTDLVFAGTSTTLRVFEGSASGWSDTRHHDIPAPGTCRVVDMLDIDMDGYDDLVTGGGGKFNLYLGGATWPTSADVSKDLGTTTPPDMAIAVPARGVGKYRGVLTTGIITLPQGKKWDILDLGATVPPNTTVSVTVLDSAGKGISGFVDRTETNLDLSGLLIDRHTSISLRVKFESESNNTTPVLDLIRVRWQDLGTWRDEFYGSAKVDRMLNLEVAGNRMGSAQARTRGPHLVFASLKSDIGYDTPGVAFWDDGSLEYAAQEPLTPDTRGSSAVDSHDVNGDGLLDLAFAVHGTSDTAFAIGSPLFLGTPVGISSVPYKEFPTVGASDVLLRDLDGDGYVDVVFAQEQRGVEDYSVNSTLFWGSDDGWADTPDVEFVTKGASGVAAADLDDDGDTDLAFSCYRNVSTNTDSLVFLQGSTGFCGTEPDHFLATHGARAVATGDIDGDGRVDLVFANSFYLGFAEVDSFIYWGREEGGFGETPTTLLTSGAEDVKVSDLDGDGDLDLVFANKLDDNLLYRVSSCVYSNGGGGTFPSIPNAHLPTTGASAVVVADLDGTGRSDLVFACGYDGTTRHVSSLVYLGGTGGWSSSPDVVLSTVGASDVAVAQLVEEGNGGYLSQVIVPENPLNTGTYHTFRYTAGLGPSQTCTLRLVDADTLEVLAETPAVTGTNEWNVEGTFRVKEHPRVRVMGLFKGLDGSGDCYLEDLWLNWTVRIQRPPRILDLGVSTTSLNRTEIASLWLNVSDEYDGPEELTITLEHRINGSDNWGTSLMEAINYSDGSWRTTLLPKADAAPGSYDFRVSALDTDGKQSDWVEFPNLLEVLNNLPTAPVLRIKPDDPPSTSILSVEFVTSSTDVEQPDIIYRYRWYRDGELVEELTGNSVSSNYTAKGENWSVEVRAFDGDDEGLPALAWTIIQNAPPILRTHLSDPELMEDTVEEDWIDLSTAFEDPDDDPLTWSVATMPEHLGVVIDQTTGKVRLTPDADWFGYANVTFIATDGELQCSQNVTVRVLPVNDIPWFETVDGKAFTGTDLNYTISLGEVLVIAYTVRDAEGDEVQASVSIPSVVLDEEAGTLTFDAGFDVIGAFTFTLRIWDVVSPREKVSLDITIEVVNENDPMEDPTITNPEPGSKFLVGQSFTLSAFCNDPDVQYGQELEFVWSSNISGELGRGTSIVVELGKPGVHLVMLTVRDPDFEKSATIEIVIQTPEDVSPPTQDGDDDGPSTNWVMLAGIILVLALVGTLVFFVGTKRRTERYEAEMDTVIEAEGKRDAWQRTAEAIKAAADEWEADEWVEDVEDDGSEERFEDEEYEEVPVQGTAGQLRMEARVIGEASDDVKRLGATVGEAKAGTSKEENEAMRLDNLKRKYQNAIGRLPFGIPSKELADRDWVYLAHELATGERKQVEDGKEVTRIDGRWYYSDPDDTDTFLKEHGAKKEERPSKAPTGDRERLLAKLEERFILGEISEETYQELKDKYSG